MQNLDTLVKHLKRYYQVRVECSKEMETELFVSVDERKRASKVIFIALNLALANA